MKRVLLKKEKQGFSKPSKMGFTQPSSMAGFTMVETLVAISILLVVIIGPMTIAQKGIQNAYFARDQLTAVFLAQEAIEAVRVKRDAQALYVYDQLIDEESPSDATWDWLGVLPVCTTEADEECRFNPTTGILERCADDTCKLRVDGNGVYSYVGGIGTNLSIFTRKVYIENIGADSVRIRVVVKWNATALGGTEKEVELQTWLYNRYKHYET